MRPFIVVSLNPLNYFPPGIFNIFKKLKRKKFFPEMTVKTLYITVLERLSSRYHYLLYSVLFNNFSKLL